MYHHPQEQSCFQDKFRLTNLKRQMHETDVDLQVFMKSVIANGTQLSLLRQLFLSPWGNDTSGQIIIQMQESDQGRGMKV